MGSFNLNCALTNLPIRENEDVKILFLTERERGSMTQASQFFKPVFPFFLDAKYMDYGRFGFGKSGRVEIAETFFREKLIPIAQGENEYHDHAVDPGTFDLNNVSDFISEGRLFIKHDEPWLKNIHQKDLPEIEGLFAKSCQQVHIAAYKTSVLDRLFAGVFEHQAYDDGEFRDVTFAERMIEVPHYMSTMDVLGFVCGTIEKRKLATIPDGDEAAKKKVLAEITSKNKELFEATLATRGDSEKVFDMVVEFADGLINHDELKVLALLHSDRKRTEFNNDFSLFISRDDNDCGLPQLKDAMEFRLFYEWFDHIYHGTFIPTRYAGQETCHAAHKQMAGIVQEVAGDYEKEMDEW